MSAPETIGGEAVGAGPGSETDPPGHPRRDRSRLVSAGQVLCVGVLCFALWLALDARALYTSALAAPLGLRRSVAAAILAPIARVSEALSLDRLVNGGDTALGRSGGPAAVTDRGASSTPPRPATPASASNAPATNPVRSVRPLGAGVAGTTARFYRPGHAFVPGYLSPTGPPPIFQPTRSAPLTILEVGDSLGEDLSYGLADLLGTDRSVRLIPLAVGSTGLANTGYYNWPAVLRRDLARYHPKVVVVLLGGNDAQPFAVGDRPAELGTPFWRAEYGKRVAAMIDESIAAGANVVWVGVPVMASPAFTARMAELNAIYAQQAAIHPGVSFVSSWRLLANRAGRYAEYLRSASGEVVQVRASDGVHLAPPAGDDLLASRVVTAMERDFGIRL